MADEKIYPKGFKVWPPRDNAPDFVRGSISIHPQEFLAFLKENAQYQDEKGYFRFDLLEGDTGMYVKLSTFKKAWPDSPDHPK